MESGSKITVVVRKRPLGRKEIAKGEQDIVEVRDIATVVVKEIKQKVDLTKYVEETNFNFDLAFDQFTTNEQLYNTAVRPIIEAAFNKAKVTCFAYGQTGSGKTHTMIGDADNGNPGLYLLASYDIFSLLQQPQFQNLSLTISFYEIYCNKLQDLLNDKAIVQPREDAKGNVNIVGLSEKKVTSVQQLMQIIQLGQSNRVVGSNSANSESSRSHALLQINLKQGKSLHGKLSFIDLAGSERGADVSDQNKQTRIDGAEINKSLLALKECIRAIDLNKNHTPFRGSKLTLVLKDSFTGNCRTVMIGNISPSNASSEHTLNTLRYADRVKELKKPNENMSQQEYMQKELGLARTGENVIKKAYRNPDSEDEDEEQMQPPRYNQQGHQGLTKIPPQPQINQYNQNQSQAHQQMMAQMANTFNQPQYSRSNPINPQPNPYQQPSAPIQSNDKRGSGLQNTKSQPQAQSQGVHQKRVSQQGPNNQPANKQMNYQNQNQNQNQQQYLNQNYNPQAYNPQQQPINPYGGYNNNQNPQPGQIWNQQGVQYPQNTPQTQSKPVQKAVTQNPGVQQGNLLSQSTPTIQPISYQNSFPPQQPAIQGRQALNQNVNSMGINQLSANPSLPNQIGNSSLPNNQMNMNMNNQLLNQYNMNGMNNVLPNQMMPNQQQQYNITPYRQQQNLFDLQMPQQYSGGIKDQGSYNRASFADSDNSDMPDQQYMPQPQYALENYIDHNQPEIPVELTPQQLEVQMLSVQHEELVQTIIQEEEDVVQTHRVQIDKMVEATKEEMMLLNQVEQAGSDIQSYVNRLHQILDEKIDFINELKGKLEDLSQHLKDEEILSSKFYEQRKQLGQMGDDDQADELQLLDDNLENFNDQY